MIEVVQQEFHKLMDQAVALHLKHREELNRLCGSLPPMEVWARTSSANC